ncbi:MAG TPA: polysaccharide pyruvyl transferase family protein, partial [Polymorphobacter sp.]|nr:polysaccharide pyruvyl transferase family protein [Polymorphobacter sp.]
MVWHSVRSGNLGVGALSVGNIALARRAAERAGLTPKFTVIGTREPGPVYISGPDISAREITGRYMASPGGYWADLGRLDYVL